MLKMINLILIILVFITNIFGVNEKIFSKGSLSPETLSQFLLSGNNNLSGELVEEFATIYIEEAKYEGINWDVAFVQMCLETGFLSYGGLVDKDQNNFCGLGSFNNRKGASFPTVREGIRAHIQHLKAYSSTEDLKNELLDPRFHFVKRGSAINATDLAGRWAEDPHYGIKLIALLEKVHFLEKTDIVLNDIPEIINSSNEVSVSEGQVRSQGSDNIKIVEDSIVSELESTENLEEIQSDEILLDDILLENSGWLR